MSPFVGKDRGVTVEAELIRKKVSSKIIYVCACVCVFVYKMFLLNLQCILTEQLQYY